MQAFGLLSLSTSFLLKRFSWLMRVRHASILGSNIFLATCYRGPFRPLRGFERHLSFEAGSGSQPFCCFADSPGLPFTVYRCVCRSDFVGKSNSWVAGIGRVSRFIDLLAGRVDSTLDSVALVLQGLCHVELVRPWPTSYGSFLADLTKWYKVSK